MNKEQKDTIIDEFMLLFDVEAKKGHYIKPHLLAQVNSIMHAITTECNNRVLMNGYADIEDVFESLIVREGDNVK